MKLSDYVINFLGKQGLKHAFVITGGASVHLIDSIGKHPAVRYICLQHEQASAMAADAYARVTKNFGVAISTSGPGATNMLTGVCSAYYDSVPVIYITGQVSTFRLKGDTGVRQIGFQETDVVDIFRPITKYAVLVDQSKKIRYELEKAVHIAKSGRPGPVLLDIPDNIQREQIYPDKLESFVPEKKKTVSNNLNVKIDECLKLFKNTKRPIIILGWGVRLAKVEIELEKLFSKLKFPVVPTWAVADFLPFNHPFNVGTFGTHGTRYANFAVQNADLILAIGTRLDTKATGSPMSTFARGAKKIVVDIDSNELNKFKKFGLDIELLIQADALDFVTELNKNLFKYKKQDISKWLGLIKTWKRKYPICTENYYKEKNVNPYVFVKALSSAASEGEVIMSDTGCALVWMMQAFEFKFGQRLYHDWNNTAMGWALPASIGASFALNGKKVLCVVGDGSLQMNIQELATVIRHRLPIKIFLINNHGYSMIQQTQDQWLNSKYLASTVEGGLAFPDFSKVARAYGFKTINISNSKNISQIIKNVLKSNGPVFCNVDINASYRVVPQVKYGMPNEDAEPLLDRNEFKECMVIEPIQVSLK